MGGLLWPLVTIGVKSSYKINCRDTAPVRGILRLLWLTPGKNLPPCMIHCISSPTPTEVSLGHFVPETQCFRAFPHKESGLGAQYHFLVNLKHHIAKKNKKTAVLFLERRFMEQYTFALRICLNLNLSWIIAQMLSRCQHVAALHRQRESRLVKRRSRDV